MPYAGRKANPVVAALWRKRQETRPPLNVANGTRTDTMPGPQVASEEPAVLTKAAWLPTISGQTIPMQGEVVYDLPADWDE